MRLSFNIAGPCLADRHYMLPPERRLVRLLELVDDEKYFPLHAGRQMGKTTAARWLMRHFNTGNEYRAAWIDLETARDLVDPAVAFRTVLGAIERGLSLYLPDLARPSPVRVQQLLTEPHSAIVRYIRALSAASPLPLMLLMDEADCLVGPTVVSFLTQLREGYLSRSDSPFPASIVLIGQRQVRDYAMTESDRQEMRWLGTTSPFHITAEATTLAPFTEAKVGELLLQHTAATGQVFAPPAIARIWELACGHPWLTNAIADQIVTWDLRDRAAPITVDHVEAAKETLIQERRTHIDDLISRLHEPRVRRVLDPRMAGLLPPADLLDDDLHDLLGLGLIVRRSGSMVIANPIYREVIPRALSWAQQVTLALPHRTWVLSDGSLDMHGLLTSFQRFWRKDGHIAAKGFRYRESGPHLMLMAFLQRIVNGGGRIEREYGLGRGALDLMVFWQQDRFAIELKLRRDDETEAEALEQLLGYLDRAGLEQGWLVLFDQRSTKPWSEKIFVREELAEGKRVWVMGC